MRYTYAKCTVGLNILKMPTALLHTLCVLSTAAAGLHTLGTTPPAWQSPSGDFSPQGFCSLSSILRLAQQDDPESEGLLRACVHAVDVLYHALSHTLLYPVFSFCFLFLSVLLVALCVLLVKQLVKGRTVAAKRTFGLAVLCLLLHTNLFLVMYEKQKVVVLFITFQRNTLLMLGSVLVGFWLGKLVSKTSFEETTMP